MRARLLAISLLVMMPMDGQHRGGFAVQGPSATVRPGVPAQSRGVGFSSGRNRAPYRNAPFAGPGLHGYNRGFRSLPHYPGWGYNSARPLYYGDESSEAYPADTAPEENVSYAFPVPGEMAARPKIANPVLREYHFGETDRNPPGTKATLTVVLKDGSRRSAVASWVAAGKLYYLDSKGQQQVLAPESIDRHATERANEGRNSQINLPPG